MADTATLTVRLPEELAETLRTHAFVTHTSVNETIKRAVIDYLQQSGRPEMVRTAFEKVLADHALALDKLKDL